MAKATEEGYEAQKDQEGDIWKIARWAKTKREKCIANGKAQVPLMNTLLIQEQNQVIKKIQKKKTQRNCGRNGYTCMRAHPIKSLQRNV